MITLNNGFILSYAVGNDDRIVKVHVCDNCAAIRARDEQAAEEIAREAAAWGADTHVAGRIAYIGA